MPADDLSRPECALVARCRIGEPGAWDELVRTYAPFLRGVLSASAERRGIRLSAGDLDDLLSRIWEDLLRDDKRLLSLYRSQTAPFKPWLSAVALDRLLLWVRTQGREFRRLEAYRKRQLPDDLVGARPPAEGERLEREAWIRDAVGKLPPKDRFAVSTFYYAGWSHRQIAWALRVPLHQVGPLLAAARDRLKALLRRREKFLIL